MKKKKRAQIHIGNNPTISHEHCRIRWGKKRNHYTLELLGKSGIKIGIPGSHLKAYKKRGQVIALPNPCQLEIQSIPIFIQAFFISGSGPSLPEHHYKFTVGPENQVKQEILRPAPPPPPGEVVFIESDSEGKQSNEIINIDITNQEEDEFNFTSENTIEPTQSELLVNRIGEAIIKLAGKATITDIVEELFHAYEDKYQRNAFHDLVQKELVHRPEVFANEPIMLNTGKRSREKYWSFNNENQQSNENSSSSPLITNSPLIETSPDVNTIKRVPIPNFQFTRTKGEQLKDAFITMDSPSEGSNPPSLNASLNDNSDNESFIPLL